METRAFDIGMIAQVLPDLLSYLDVTLLVGFVSIALGSLLGGLLAWVNISGTRPLRWLTVSYVYVMRCTPSIVLLFIVFYGLPKLAFAVFDYDMNDLHRAVFAIITFTLLFGAYISEVFRAAYKAVPRGQFEAARVLGMSAPLTMRRIVLPQVLRITLPPVSNETINLVKDTSLVYILAMNDLLRVARTIVQREFDMTPFLIAGIFYLAMTAVLTYGFKKLEAHYGRYES